MILVSPHELQLTDDSPPRIIHLLEVGMSGRYVGYSLDRISTINWLGGDQIEIYTEGKRIVTNTEVPAMVARTRWDLVPEAVYNNVMQLVQSHRMRVATTEVQQRLLSLTANPKYIRAEVDEIKGLLDNVANAILI